MRRKVRKWKECFITPALTENIVAWIAESGALGIGVDAPEMGKPPRASCVINLISRAAIRRRLHWHKIIMLPVNYFAVVISVNKSVPARFWAGAG